MKKLCKYLFLSILLPFVFCAFSKNSNLENIKGNWEVIPMPAILKVDSLSKGFVIDKNVTIVYPNNEGTKRVASLLAKYISNITGVKVKTANKKGGGGNIVLVVDSTIVKNAEGYEIVSKSNEIIVIGGSERGVFYGAQTIHKALPITIGKKVSAVLPEAEIKDAPRFGYRGFMIDVGRHFFTVDYLKEMIDVMAMHNINYFHWHLTEDQGWRIEIKKYPKLTEIGSKRAETIRCWETQEFDGVPYGGFYTQEQAKEIVQYAADRFITVIPEVDMPGHMLAALASYPEMGCTGGPYKVPTSWGVFADVLCGGNDSNIQFAKDVLAELMEIFPSEYIHIGGDECPKSRWKECPKCQQKIKELGLVDTPKHSKENQLQTYFMGEVEKFINEKGRKMLGWDEILEGGLTPNSTVVSWRGLQGGIEAAKQHHNAIITPISHLYFSNPGYNRLRGVSSIKRVYEFEPVPAELTPDEQKYIIGTQGCIWTEWTKDSLKMEWQIFPRMAALSEIQWSAKERKNTECFLNRLSHQLELYKLYGLHYKDDIEQVDVVVTPIEGSNKVTITMSTFDNAPIYYTSDGLEPNLTSLVYKKPLISEKGIHIRAAAYRNGKMGIVTTVLTTK